MLVLLSAFTLSAGALAAPLPPGPWSPVPAPGGWGATFAEWRLTIRDGEPVLVSATYTLATPDVRGGQLDLVGPELLVTNVDGPVFASPGGLSIVLEPGRTSASQSFEGLYAPPSEGALSLSVLPAARAHITIDAPDLDVTIDGAVDGWLSPRDTLSVTWRPRREGEILRENTVIQGEAATTFRGDAGALAVDSVLRWRVVRGEATRFTFSAGGLEELEVTGANIAGWQRAGDTVTVRPKTPVKGLFTVAVRGRAPIRKGEQAAPTPTPLGVLRVDRYVTMARSDEGELIPVAMPESVALTRLPAWARNLSDAPPLAAWHGPQPVRVLAATWEALQGPDTVVTAARYTLAAAREGRAALRMNLRVRNERRQYLRFRPPPGWTPIVVRVGNQPVSWLSDGAGGIYVPLEKSIETVKGLLSFPVDVEWIGESSVWLKRGEHEFKLPSVDAPVQTAAWEVHLPRGFRALRPPDKGGDRFTLTDLRRADELEDESPRLEEDRRKNEMVSSALQNASSAWKDNDFDGAQRWVDNAREVDADNEEIEYLQSNLDVLAGKSASSNAVEGRRVKELAKAKTSGLSSRQQTVEEEAKNLYRAGDLDAAERSYSEALAVANELQKTEQAESVDQKVRIAEAESKLEAIRGARAAKGQAVADDDEGIAGLLGGESMGGLGIRGSGLGGGGVSQGMGAIGTKGRGGGRGESAGGQAQEEQSAKEPSAGEPSAGEPIDFEYIAVEGELRKPGVLLDRTRAAPLVQTRGDFDDEIADSISTVTGALSGRGDASGASSTETSYVLDGVDSTTGTFSLNFKSEADEPLDTGAVEGPAPVVTRELLQQIPAGRSYQSVASASTGKIANDKSYKSGKKDAAPRPPQSAPQTKAPPAPAKPEAPEPPRQARDATRASSPRSPAAAASPPPPPPPPSVVSGNVFGSADEQGYFVERPPAEASGEQEEYEKYEQYEEPGDANGLPDTAELEALGYLDEAEGWDDDAEPDEPPVPEPMADEPAADHDGERTSGARMSPARPRPRPPPERRKPLVASPSPMALAMPLDGPAITTSQALLPADTFPTWRFLYKELPPEKR